MDACRMALPIVLLTGPPGGGRSTVGRLVAEAFDRSVHIEAVRMAREPDASSTEPME